MRFWLVTVGEPLPIDGSSVRLLRTAQYANWLALAGHDVTFWTGTMDHYNRSLRESETTITQVVQNYKIVQLKGRHYKRSISINRFMNHVDVAKSFSSEAGKHLPPDVILASYPTEELCRSVLDYAESQGIPVIIDIRDLWPDIFVDALPSALKFLAPSLLYIYDKRASDTLKRAHTICGPAKSMVEWGVSKAASDGEIDNFIFPFTYVKHPSENFLSEFPDPSQIDDRQDYSKFCFFGALSHRVNLKMVIDSFRLLEEKGVRASIMICGSGDAAEELRAHAKGLSNVFFPGWLNADQISHLMSLSIGGVFPYNTPDYFNNLPNKVCEYLAGGLPIFSCTEGEVRRLIEENNCGFWSEPSANSFAEMISQALRTPDKVERCAQRADELYQKKFEQGAVFRKTTDRIMNIINSSVRD